MKPTRVPPFPADAKVQPISIHATGPRRCTRRKKKRSFSTNSKGRSSYSSGKPFTRVLMR
ncbi:MAG TPA: hypothetical protein VF993_16675 [Myxococcales bacterium]